MNKEIKKIIDLVKENNQKNNAEIVVSLLAIGLKLERLGLLEQENQELKDSITKTYSEFGYSNLSDFRKEMRKIFIENQDLKEWCLILNKHLYIAPEMCELRMATPKNADFLIKNSSWTKYYNGIDVHEIDYKKFADLYYSKIKEVLEE